jgi:lipid-A-disaccharide synthase
MATGHSAPVRYDPAGPILLLPGSRAQAVARIFPVLLAGHRALGEREAVVLFPSVEILNVLRAANPPPEIKLLPVIERRSRSGGSGRPFEPRESIAASAVLTSSGTMSMHCALAGIPGAIAYRANPLTYLLGRMLVQVEYLGIANLLLGEPMYPEYIQGAATPAALAAELRDCLHNPKRRDQTTAQASRLNELLRVPASGTASDWLIRSLG